jgi:putative transposase
MPRQCRLTADSGIYHVMLRGVNRDAIFLETADYERFLHTLVVVKSASGCQVLAYCLMTNHVHLVLRAGGEPISAVMKRLGVRYANWFNRKYGRVGHLFQNRFASVPVEDDAYLVTLIRYVWNNPVAAGLVPSAEQYDWSSRRYLHRDSIVVDNHHLRSLVDEGGIAELAASSPLGTQLHDAPGSATRPNESQTADLLARACGASGPSEFAKLDRTVQRRAIGELRTQSVPYVRIAKATGMTVSSVRRIHVSAQ